MAFKNYEKNRHSQSTAVMQTSITLVSLLSEHSFACRF